MTSSSSSPPIDGLLANGYRAISIALQLDDAADRFAGTEVPAGVLEEQDGGEDLSADELAASADVHHRPPANTTAATNKYVSYREVDRTTRRRCNWSRAAPTRRSSWPASATSRPTWSAPRPGPG